MCLQTFYISLLKLAQQLSPLLNNFSAWGKIEQYHYIITIHALLALFTQ